MERVWTEKEPLVPEWYDHKDEKKDQGDGMPKLTMKLLYGMILELQQRSDRLSARLDEFEHYMIEVQATRAQLEADAARTIARAKAAASLQDRSAFADAAMTAPGQAAAAAASPMQLHKPVDTNYNADEELIKTITAIENEPLTAAAKPEMNEADPLVDTPNTAAIDASIDASIDVSIDAAEVVSHNANSETLFDMNRTNDQEEPAASDAIDVVDLIPLHTKPSKLESQPSYLMSLAQEVLGFTTPDEAEEGLDPGEGANPFDPDNFAAHSIDTAEGQAAPASSLPVVQHGSPSGVSSPFFTPRSQRHQASKKTFLSLFGFRTRIS